MECAEEDLMSMADLVNPFVRCVMSITEVMYHRFRRVYLLHGPMIRRA